MRNRAIKLSTIAALFMALFMLFTGGATRARAAEGTDETVGAIAAAFDERDVLDDLDGMEIDGKKFSLDNFGFNANRPTQVLALIELCYSFRSDKQDDYGLYVYVYNPQGIAFDKKSEQNAINIKFGTDEKAHSDKLPLLLCDVSTRQNFEGLFWKFKVDLTPEKKEEALWALNSTRRAYRVGEVELASGGIPASVTVGTTFYYEGYAAGFGADPAAESTLKMSYEESDVLELIRENGDFHFTQYRPSGSNGKNEFTQDSLHSVYFSVPKDFITRYGELAAVHATWIDAVLNPAIVTGSETVYNALVSKLGKNIGTYDPSLDIYLYGNWWLEENLFGGVTEWGRGGDYTYGYAYNGDCWRTPQYNFHREYFGEDITTLWLLFFADNGEYVVSPEKIEEELKKQTETLKADGDELIMDRYAKKLFSEIGEPVDMTIKWDDEISLTSETVSRKWWERLLGIGATTIPGTFDGIEGIHTVTAEDLKGSDAEISQRLYVDKNDVAALKEFFNSRSAEEAIYLMRYEVTDYMTQKMMAMTDRKAEVQTLGSRGTVPFASNNYVFYETVNLGWDMIDVTFSNGEKETVIPVAMTPTDVIPDATPPTGFFGKYIGPELIAIVALIVSLVAALVIDIIAERAFQKRENDDFIASLRRR